MGRLSSHCLPQLSICWVSTSIPLVEAVNELMLMSSLLSNDSNTKVEDFLKFSVCKILLASFSWH